MLRSKSRARCQRRTAAFLGMGAKRTGLVVLSDQTGQARRCGQRGEAGQGRQQVGKRGHRRDLRRQVQPVGVGHLGHPVPRQEPGLDQAPQHRRKPVSAEPFRSNGLLASLAHILGGEHDGQQPCGVARQRRARVGAVIGGDGSGDVVSATQVGGHSSGVPWLRQGRAGRTRARASPRQEKSLAKRAELGEARIVRSTASFPGTAGCSWPTLTGGLWHFWVLGSAGSFRQRGGIGTASACEPARPNRVAPRPNLFFGAVAPSGSRGWSWLRQEVPPPLRQRCHLLCPMRPGHARDNCRHIEIHLPAVGDFSGHWWIVPKNRGRRSDDVMTAPLSPLPASAAQYIDTRRTDAACRNRRADPDYSEMRPRSWLPIRCPNRARPRQPAHSSRSVCSADQPASFDAIVFPPHGLSRKRPFKIRTASEWHPVSILSST